MRGRVGGDWAKVLGVSWLVGSRAGGGMVEGRTGVGRVLGGRQGVGKVLEEMWEVGRVLGGREWVGGVEEAFQTSF